MRIRYSFDSFDSLDLLDSTGLILFDNHTNPEEIAAVVMRAYILPTA